MVDSKKVYKCTVQVFSEPDEFYARILHVVNFFVVQANGLKLEEILDLDPNIESILKILKSLEQTVRSLSSDSFEDQDMSINSLQCCIVMQRLIKAVRAGDENEFQNMLGELDGLAGAPIPSKRKQGGKYHED